MLELTAHPLTSTLPPSLTRALLNATSATNTLPSLDLQYFESMRKTWLDAFDALRASNTTFWCINADFQCCVYADRVILGPVSKGVEKEWARNGIEYQKVSSGFTIFYQFRDAFLSYLRAWVDPVSERIIPQLIALHTFLYGTLIEITVESRAATHSNGVDQVYKHIIKGLIVDELFLKLRNYLTENSVNDLIIT